MTKLQEFIKALEDADAMELATILAEIDAAFALHSGEITENVTKLRSLYDEISKVNEERTEIDERLLSRLTKIRVRVDKLRSTRVDGEAPEANGTAASGASKLRVVNE